MSSRDDVNEIGFGSDSTWGGLQSMAESTGRGRDQLLIRLYELVSDAGYASEVYADKVLSLFTETAYVSEEWFKQLLAHNAVMEHGRGHDEVLSRYRSTVEDAGFGADLLLEAVRSIVTDRARGFDVVVDQRHALDGVNEQGHGGDLLLVLKRSLVEDWGWGGNVILGTLRARDALQDQGFGTDEAIDANKAHPVVLSETAKVFGELFGLLYARDLVGDTPAVGWDELLALDGLLGQAWTADASAWAMSRYAPFGFSGLAVIDGAVYATAPDGVYALDGDAEPIRAELRTGLMDMTGDVLALPVESHLEYELSAGGKAWVDVTQTQSGKAQTYSYPLKGRPHSDVLTNARAEFGRGLRGRHFAYTLRLQGERAYINDWSVLAMPSKRSL